MRYHEIIGLVDDTFAKYRKDEATPDSKWNPFGFYKNITDVKNDYSVYSGSVRDALIDLIDLYQQDQKIQFNDKEKYWCKYNWLNNSLFLCKPGGFNPDGISLRVWRVL